MGLVECAVSNSIGAIDAIGVGEGGVESRAMKSRMLIGWSPNDLPLPHVVPAGFDGDEPAVIDEDLRQAQGGFSIPDRVGPVACRCPARSRWACPRRAGANRAVSWPGAVRESVRLDPEILFASVA